MPAILPPDGNRPVLFAIVVRKLDSTLAVTQLELPAQRYDFTHQQP